MSRRFERMESSTGILFFDLEDFENIIDHYVTNAEFDKALVGLVKPHWASTFLPNC
jgi:hypothetical protein